MPRLLLRRPTASLLLAAGLGYGGAADTIAASMIDTCQVFPSDHIFNTQIDNLPVHPDSAAYLQTISSGTRRLHLDLGPSEDMQSPEYYGIPYNVVNGSAINWPSLFYTDGYPDESDCGLADHSIARPCVNTPSQPQMPIPASPLVEGGIETDQANYGDHHILVVDRNQCVLWESYHSYPHSGGGWDVMSTAAFNLNSNALRPKGWTSADAAGFPILPLLLRADEASSGEIQHALRFTIQSSKIRAAYVWPATHLTSNGGSSSSKPAMGQLFRLKASYAIPASFTVQSRAILAAMQKYGMYIADGGSDMYVTGNPSAGWSSDTISQVQTVPHTAFEAVDLRPIMARAGFDVNSAAVPPAAATTAPQCTLSATPGTIAAGGSASLTASCTPAATSYAWTNTGFAATAASGSVSPVVTTTYSVTGSNAAGSGNTANVAVIVGSAAVSQTDVRTWLPAAASGGYTSYLRVINTGNAATPVLVALIDGASGTLDASHQLSASLAAGGALTVSSQQVEAALGTSLPGSDRPRIRVTGLASALEVQSFLLQPGGAFNEVSGAQSGASVTVDTYVPAAAAGSGYVSYLRVINTGNTATPVTVARIDPASGLTGAAGTLNAALPAGAALTYTATQVEAALGAAIAGSERPRIALTATASTLEVQSFLIQPGGAFTEVSSGQSGSPIDVRSYVPAATPAYTTYLRVINGGSTATPIIATLLDDVTGVALASGTLIGSLPGKAAATFASAAVESAMGVTISAGSRPRIRLSSPTGAALRTQSLLLQPGGAFNEISNAIGGTPVIVRTYVPAADAASGYTSYLRVINPGATASAVTIALVDATSGVTGAAHTLIASLPGGAAQTFSSGQIEAALGTVVAAGARPRIQISSTIALEVQSFLTQPGGAFTEVSGGQ